MMNVPEKIPSVSHPLVASMYLKKGYGAKNASEDVLVIETNFSQAAGQSRNFDSCLTELLGDLHELQIQAEQKIGHFDRVDIRTP